MSNTKKQKRIRALLNYTRTSAAELLPSGQAVVKGMTANPRFTNSPIEPALLKTTLDDLSIAIGDAVDGGKKALHERDRLREDVIRMLRILAHYVEATCNDDMAAFLSSGFLPQTSTRVAPQ